MTQPHCPCLRRGAMRLEESELREWVRRVTQGEASRRDFIRTMLGFWLSGPLIAEMLRTQTSAMAQGRRAVQPTFSPPRRGGGGKLRLLYWNAPTILNAHFAGGAKEVAGSPAVYATFFYIDPEGVILPLLAVEFASDAK